MGVYLILTSPGLKYRRVNAQLEYVNFTAALSPLDEESGVC
jgi:hypothetical protein